MSTLKHRTCFSKAEYSLADYFLSVFQIHLTSPFITHWMEVNLNSLGNLAMESTTLLSIRVLSYYQLGK